MILLVIDISSSEYLSPIGCPLTLFSIILLGVMPIPHIFYRQCFPMCHLVYVGVLVCVYTVKFFVKKNVPDQIKVRWK